MQKGSLIGFFLILGYLVSAGQSEVLRAYDPSATYVNQTTNYNLLVQRFDLPRPAHIQKVRVLTAGTSGSSIEIALFGHEGGTSFPQFEQEITPFQRVTKTTDGDEWLEVEFPEGLPLDNTQFFVAFRNASGSIFLKAEQKPAEAACRSGSGGDYFSLFQRSGNSWSVRGLNSYILDVHLEYDPHPDRPHFEDVTHAIGVDTLLSNRSMAWADLNGDHYPELLVSGRLYINRKGTLQDITQDAGLHGSPRANAIVDMDNDGDLDIVFIDAGDTSSIFEQVGDLQFTQHVLEGLPDFISVSSLSFADLNFDGFPDMFIGQLWGEYPVPQSNYLYQNMGDWTVTDISRQLYPNHVTGANFPGGVVCDPGNSSTWLPNQNRNRRSRGSAFTDYNQDGIQDLYSTNYFLEQDEFYEGQATGFKNVIAEKGISANNTGYNHGTGVDWGDYDRDGDMDLLLPQFAHPAFATQFDHRTLTIYRNEGSPDFSFYDTRGENGIQFEETYAGGTWGDVNNDGLLDLYVTVFYGCRYVKLYIQQEDHSFKLVTSHYGIDRVNTGTDAVWVDVDQDGLLDLCSGKNNRIRIYRNRGQYGNNYLKVDLSGSRPNAQALGSQVTAHYGGFRFTQEVQAGRGQKMQQPYQLHFGLGKFQTIDSLVIKWPDGAISVLYDVQANKKVQLVQPAIQGLTTINVFPNPSNALFYFDIGMEKGQDCLIEVYAVNGQKVATVKESYLAAGHHRIYWHSAHQPGMYFYRAEIGEDRFSGKLFLH